MNLFLQAYLSTGLGWNHQLGGVTSHMQLFAMMTVLDFGDTVNGSELLHHLGCLKYKNPVNNGINYQPQPVRRISAINSSYSWITRNRCFLRFGQFGRIWTLGEVHQSLHLLTRRSIAGGGGGHFQFGGGGGPRTQTPSEKEQTFAEFLTKDSLYSQYNCRFFQKNPKFISFPAKTQSGLKVFFNFLFLFFLVYSISISYLL